MLIIIKCWNKRVLKQLRNVFLLCEGGTGVFLRQKRLGRNPVSPFKIGFAVMYTIPMKKFGSRYPDGVEPSHTVVCSRTILVCCRFLHKSPPMKCQKNDKLLKNNYFYIHIKTVDTTLKCCLKTRGKMLVVVKTTIDIFLLPAQLHKTRLLAWITLLVQFCTVSCSHRPEECDYTIRYRTVAKQ